MPPPTDSLSEARQLRPASPAEVAEAVRSAALTETPVYPVGGATSLDFGLAPAGGGTEIHVGDLNGVIDYASADMTITVEAGITVAVLQSIVGGERQQLPLDAPHSEAATIGGLIATHWSGPRRLGYGTMRDYLIGITAVDGRGVTFHGGGRVVKNVAGYDFCKLLVGSLGTIGVITQATLKLKPIPDCVRTLVAPVKDWDTAERALAAAVDYPFVPAAVELLAGPGWSAEPRLAPSPGNIAVLVVRIEGTQDEVEFMDEFVRRHIAESGITNSESFRDGESEKLLEILTGFGRQADPSAAPPLAIKIVVPPGAVVETCRRLREVNASASIQAHAGDGIVIVEFDEFDASDLSDVIVANLRPAALRQGGSLVVLRSEFEGLTPQIVWGGRSPANSIMDAIKKQFDPHGILNPGRLPYTR